MQQFIAHVVGARPNFPKAAPVIRALRGASIDQRVVHTGQHYDNLMSDVFFEQLGMGAPTVNLKVGPGRHGAQTAAVLAGSEEFFESERPALVIVYGDVNSTVAAALAAAKMGIPVAHVEAGLRSFDNRMPEEINRRVTDALSSLLFVTCADAAVNLGREGIDHSKVHFVGNPMIESLLDRLDEVKACDILAKLDLEQAYGVVTLHRPSNVDDPHTAAKIVQALGKVSERLPLVIPLHPRGRQALLTAGLGGHRRIKVIDPLGYIEFLSLLDRSQLTITDSGGVQEETTVLGVPCLTLRENTERPVTITNGTNQLVSESSLPEAVARIADLGRPAEWSVPPLWDQKVGARVARAVLEFLG
jgi:UDP-N-acetylglucosamine 2-epimerase (non-hydrolysing)